MKISAKNRYTIAPAVKLSADTLHEICLPESPNKQHRKGHSRGRSADWVYSSTTSHLKTTFSNETTHHNYDFDFIFNANMSQEDVLASVFVRSLAFDTIQGLSTSFLVFGARGTGKTHSLIGSKENPGIIPHSLCELFRQIELESENDNSIVYSVQLSVVTVRNNSIRSLLSTVTNHHSFVAPENLLNHKSDHTFVSSSPKNKKDQSLDSFRIDVREHPKVGMFLVCNGNNGKVEHSSPRLKVAVSSADEAISILSNCSENRSEIFSR